MRDLYSDFSDANFTAMSLMAMNGNTGVYTHTKTSKILVLSLAAMFLMGYGIAPVLNQVAATVNAISAQAANTATRGVASLGQIVGLSIGIFVFAVLVPLGISEVYSANTTGWNAAVVTVFTVLLPILGIIAGVMLFLPGKSRR